MTEPSDWHLSRLVMERERYRQAQADALQARLSYREALCAAHCQGWSWRALAARLGASHAQLSRDGRHGSSRVTERSLETGLDVAQGATAVES